MGTSTHGRVFDFKPFSFLDCFVLSEHNEHCKAKKINCSTIFTNSPKIFYLVWTINSAGVGPKNNLDFHPWTAFCALFELRNKNSRALLSLIIIPSCCDLREQLMIFVILTVLYYLASQPITLQLKLHFSHLQSLNKWNSSTGPRWLRIVDNLMI